MRSNNIDSPGLKLLDDRVLDPAVDRDDFCHEVYANVLAKIFHVDSGNKPGLSIALFGKWGQGKSSIVRLMENQLARNADSTSSSLQGPRVIWFNAWQSRGDHVRRQLLLAILKGINSPKYRELAKFLQPGIPLNLRPFEEQEDVKSKTKFLAFATEEWKTWKGRIFLLIGAFSLLAFFASLFFSNWHDQVGEVSLLGILVSLGNFVFSKFKSRQIQILAAAEPVSDSQRLKFPEQFQRVFEEELADYKNRSNRPLVVVVDDLDRCEAKTVAEALSCIRQLGGKPVFVKEMAECRFLVPCDEGQVIEALAEDGHHPGYKEDELLRKFFDAIVRMDDFIPDDMVAYVDSALSQVEGVSAEEANLMRELVGAVAPRNPREVKKLINAFLVFREKLTEMRRTGALRDEGSLPEQKHTQLFAIAIQETIPSEYDKLALDPEHLERLRKVDEAEKPTEQEERAARILRALEPVSAHTLRLLTRKGLPESLRSVNNGAEVYDAVLAGDSHGFAAAVLETDNLSSIATWMKERRQSIHTIAQFRHGLSCLLEVASPPELLLEVVADYLRFSQFLPGLLGTELLLDLARIHPEVRADSQERIIQAVCSSFQQKENENLLGSIELSAMLTLGYDLPRDDANHLKGRVSGLLRTENPETAFSQLTALKESLEASSSGRSNGLFPEFALEISKSCTWEFHSSPALDGKGLHSNPIVTFIGNEEENLLELLESFSKGPLGAPIDLEHQPKGPWNEALNAIRELACRFSDKAAIFLVSFMKPWILAQPQSPPTALRRVANSIQSALAKAGLDETQSILDTLIDSSVASEDPIWICDFVDKAWNQGPLTVDSLKDARTSVFLRLAEVHLQKTGMTGKVKSLLGDMHSRRWDLQTEADRALASALLTGTLDASTWEEWKDGFWPLCNDRAPELSKGISKSIQEGLLLGQLLPFAVTALYKGKLGQSLQVDLKTYFQDPNSIDNQEFISLFEGDSIEGAEGALTLAAEDWSKGITSLNDSQIEFLVRHCPPDSQELLQERIRIELLQNPDQDRLLTGIKHIQVLGTPSQKVASTLRSIAEEQSDTLAGQVVDQIGQILGFSPALTYPGPREDDGDKSVE